MALGHYRAHACKHWACWISRSTWHTGFIHAYTRENPKAYQALLNAWHNDEQACVDGEGLPDEQVAAIAHLKQKFHERTRIPLSNIAVGVMLDRDDINIAPDRCNKDGEDALIIVVTKTFLENYARDPQAWAAILEHEIMHIEQWHSRKRAYSH